MSIDTYFDPISKISIEEFVTSAKTGDVVFFWSNNSQYGLSSYYAYIASSLQAKATQTPYTHVAVVYRSDTDNSLHLITADRVLAHDNITGTEKTGNQMIDARSYLENYKGRVVWYQLQNPANDASIANALSEFTKRIDHEYYMNIPMFVNLGLQIWTNKSESEKTICTTTVWDFLHTCGIIGGPGTVYGKINRANVGLRELEAAMFESCAYSREFTYEIS
jgi:hypothetical protein